MSPPPVPGCNLKYSKQFKPHLLFDGEIRTFLQTWRTLRGVGEQNIKGVHLQFNQLVRHFGNTRGRQHQEFVINEFLFSYSAWVAGTVDDMLKKTKRRMAIGKTKENEDNTIAPLNFAKNALTADPVGHTNSYGRRG